MGSGFKRKSFSRNKGLLKVLELICVCLQSSYPLIPKQAKLEIMRHCKHSLSNCTFVMFVKICFTTVCRFYICNQHQIVLNITSKEDLSAVPSLTASCSPICDYYSFCWTFFVLDTDQKNECIHRIALSCSLLGCTSGHISHFNLKWHNPDCALDEMYGLVFISFFSLIEFISIFSMK